MQLAEVQEQTLHTQQVRRVIAVAPLHRMVVPVRLVQSRPQRQPQILVLEVAGRAGQQVQIWSEETVPLVS
jgi:hypothetical protein